ncbi:hypothetical protein D8S78_10305 [Natrialba swarupiae]|nr:hypothetical protein [Natrialba swarupiae]
MMPTIPGSRYRWRTSGAVKDERRDPEDEDRIVDGERRRGYCHRRSREGVRVVRRDGGQVHKGVSDGSMEMVELSGSW